MKKLKDVDYKIISELMKDSRISDRKLAKAVGVSQPTVSRKRALLQKEELLDFTQFQISQNSALNSWHSISTLGHLKPREI